MLVLAAAPAAKAQTFTFSDPATVTASRQEALASYRLPVGPWTGAAIDKQLVEGAL